MKKPIERKPAAYQAKGPGTPEWEAKANRMARDFAPPIKACKQCGEPCVDGYVCRSCGDGG